MKRGSSPYAAYERIKWYLLIRLAISVVLLGSVAVFSITEVSAALESAFTFLALLVGVVLVITLVSLWFFKLNKGIVSPSFRYFQLIVDVLFACALVYATGGARSPFVLMYYLPVVFGGWLMHRRGAYISAALSAVAYGALMVLQYHRLIHSLIGPSGVYLEELTVREFVIRYCINMMFLAVTAYVTAYFTDKLQSTEIKLKDTTTALAQSERLKNDIVYSIDTGILTVDENGVITLANAAAASILGKSEENIAGHTLQKICPEISGLLSSESKKEFETKINRDGRIIHLECRLIGLTSPVGEKRGSMLLLRDITELREAQERMARQKKLAAVGKMAAGIAHEIRNPLASVSGSIELLRDGNLKKEEYSRLVDIVLRETQRLNRLINDFLNFARPVEPKFERCRLDIAVKETVELIRSEVSRESSNINIDTDLEECEIEADPSQMRQVAWNLIKNAVEAVDENGRVSVSLRKVNHSVMLEVSDNGEGMSEEEINRMFDPFFTTKHTGTGLGLSAVHRIAESHGALIDVKSEKGTGTTVKIEFPIRGLS